MKVWLCEIDSAEFRFGMRQFATALIALVLSTASATRARASDRLEMTLPTTTSKGCLAPIKPREPPSTTAPWWTRRVAHISMQRPRKRSLIK
jgi:hypothetical protein